jgi:hypothetical protein
VALKIAVKTVMSLEALTRLALTIQPNSNTTGRADNTTAWDEEFTIIVSDWYVLIDTVYRC